MNSSAEQMVGNFLRAALNPTGACQLNFSYVDLSVSTAANWTLVPNTQLNVPLEVRNLGAEETQGGELRIDLPAGVHTVPGGLPSGCSLVWGDSDRGPQGISCDLPALPGQSSHIFQIPVMGEEAGEFTVGLEVMPLEMDGNLSNNVSSTQMKMVGTTVVTHAVPVNGGIFLWGLSCLMGLAWVRRRKMH
ncbi:hypothetical protein SDC9_150532 [bioreactor metagenome]|uniref:IPTL-CTERM protein sorting domain-containing protein n=1 Tax=bioreactor metagenome TaxID=1076179 RepID=A0A645EMQ4_9ZZZZ